MTARKPEHLVPFDQNGHALLSHYIDAEGKWTEGSFVDVGLYELLTDMNERQAEMEALKDLPPRDTDLWWTLHLGYGGCSWCGKRPPLEYDKDKEVRATTPCPNPDGITTVWTIRVPSGKVVVRDDMRDLYSLPPQVEEHLERNHDYNTAIGRHHWSLAYAKELGVAYGPVGNSCPGLYKTGEGTYIVANQGYNEDYEPIDEPSWEHLTGITTDLWAFMIADHDDYLARGGTFSQYGPAVVEIPPGVYEFTHHYGERAFNHDGSGPSIYTHIKRIEDL